MPEDLLTQRKPLDEILAFHRGRLARTTDERLGRLGADRAVLRALVAQVPQDLVDDLRFLDQRDHAYLATAPRALQRVHLVDQAHAAEGPRAAEPRGMKRGPAASIVGSRDGSRLDHRHVTQR